MSKIKYCWNCKCEVPYQFYNNIDYIPTCPNCGVSYPEKPKDEALLSIYQDEYLKESITMIYSLSIFKNLLIIRINVASKSLFNSSL